jgi:hypothetical protein
MTAGHEGLESLVKRILVQRIVIDFQQKQKTKLSKQQAPAAPALNSLNTVPPDSTDSQH